MRITCKPQRAPLSGDTDATVASRRGTLALPWHVRLGRLVGQAGHKNGEKLLRTGLVACEEWRDAHTREVASRAALADGPGAKASLPSSPDEASVGVATSAAEGAEERAAAGEGEPLGWARCCWCYKVPAAGRGDG